MILRNLIAALGATVVLAACSGILPKAEPFDVYRLAPPQPDAAASTGNGVDWHLRIETPDASRSLAGPRIVVLPDAQRVSVYAGARWAERMPVLLRNHLLEAFRVDGRVPMVSSDDDGLPADLHLGSRLVAFQAEQAATEPEVVLTLDAWLTGSAGPRSLANRRFSVREPADGRDVTSVVAAFNRAAGRLDAEILTWTLETGPRLVPAAAEPARSGE